MNWLWTTITGLGALGLGVAGSILFNRFKQQKRQDKQKWELNQKERLQKSQLLINAFFELKENISYLENISDLIKEGQTNNISHQLERIEGIHAINLSKLQNLTRKEFELIDQLHSIIIAERKIDFYLILYHQEKISLLEFRANVDNFIDEALKTRQKIIEYYGQIY
ncbi:MAG: hypothetical protein PHN32_07895 [Actinomycetota bacterium]|jgi:hypothetical protein|nr:hypothetical protein [Actinomycetota bacterium]